MDEFTNQLIEAPEDEDIDDLNDLTFGNTTDNFDGADWEKHHEELAYSGPLYDASGGYVGYHEDDVDFDELQLQETDLEHKLNQLVVDDEDDEHEEPTNTVPIKQKRQLVSLDELFGPQSPPGLFDTEDLAMGQPNIWGSPARESFVAAGNSEIQGLLRKLLHKSGSSTDGGLQELGILPKSAKTLEELEQSLLQDVQELNSRAPSQHDAVGAPRVLTVEELERQLRGETSDTPADSTASVSVPAPTAPVRVPGLVTLPAGMRMPGLPVQLQSGNNTAHRPSNNVRFNQAQHHTGPHPSSQQPFWTQNMGVPTRLMGNNAFNRMMGHPRQMNQRYPMPPPGYGGYGAPPPFSGAVPGGGMMRHPSDNNQFNQHRHYMQNDRPPFMNAMHPGMNAPPPPGVFPPRMGLPPQRNAAPNSSIYPLQRQQMFQQQQMMVHQRAGFQTGMFPGGGMPHPAEHHWHNMAHGGQDSESADEYAGLMTQREKDWVIKIQMLQLHTDNPYVDDYYYTCWSVRKMLIERQRREALNPKNGSGNTDEPALVLPQLAKVETRAYEPAHFEGALGRLTSSSIHNPRQIITVQHAPASDNDEVHGIVEVKRFKELLLRIEKGYESLLDIEDTEKKALAQPPESRKALFDERKLLIGQLYRRLKGHHAAGDSNVDSCTVDEDDDSLAQIMTVRKGLYLALRLTPLLDKADAQNVICLLLRKMSTRKEWQTEVLAKVYKTVSCAVYLADLESLVIFATTLCHGETSLPASSPTDKNSINRLVSTIQCSFGVSVILSMLSRGETIYMTESPLDLDTVHQNDWRQFVNGVASAIELCDKTQLAPSLDSFPLASAHLHRMLDKRSMLLLEDRLESVLRLATAPSPAPSVPVT